MIAKPMKSLELHYPMIQFLINIYIYICLGIKVVLDCPKPSIFYSAAFGFGKWLACVASVSVRFRSKERGTRVKNPVPRSFFAPKLNGNASTQASKWLICAAATVPCWLRTNCAQASKKIVYIHKSKAMHVPRDSRLKKNEGLLGRE